MKDKGEENNKITKKFKFIGVTLKEWLPARNGTLGGRQEGNLGHCQVAICVPAG